MKLFLHIGVEKTGSTSVQKFFLHNRNNLIKYGAYFPSDNDIFDQREGNCIGLSLFTNCKAVKSLGRNSRFYLSLTPEQYKHKFEESLRESVYIARNQGANVFFLSNEHLSSRLSALEIRVIKALLDTYFNEIRILVYLRDQSEAILSLYSTYLNSGGEHKFEEFIIHASDYINHQYNYKNLLARWSEEFGQSNVYPYIYSSNVHLRLLEHLVWSVDLQSFQGSASSHNISLKGYQLFLKRWLNKISKKLFRVEFSLLKRIVFRTTYILINFLNLYPSVNQSGKIKAFLTASVKEKFDFKDSNIYVSKKYFGKENIFHQ